MKLRLSQRFVDNWNFCKQKVHMPLFIDVQKIFYTISATGTMIPAYNHFSYFVSHKVSQGK